MTTFISIVSILVKSYTVSQLWLWFLVPLGVMPINMFHSYGIILLVGLCTVGDADLEVIKKNFAGLFDENLKDQTDMEMLFTQLLHLILVMITLGIGYICHYFM